MVAGTCSWDGRWYPVPLHSSRTAQPILIKLDDLAYLCSFVLPVNYSINTAYGAPTSPSSSWALSLGHTDAPAAAGMTCRKARACGACGHQQLGAHRKEHYFGQSFLVVRSLQGVGTLPIDHAFCNRAQCEDQYCVCRMM